MSPLQVFNKNKQNWVSWLSSSHQPDFYNTPIPPQPWQQMEQFGPSALRPWASPAQSPRQIRKK